MSICSGRGAGFLQLYALLLSNNSFVNSQLLSCWNPVKGNMAGGLYQTEQAQKSRLSLMCFFLDNNLSVSITSFNH